MSTLDDRTIEATLRQLASATSAPVELDVAAMVVAAVHEPGIDSAWALDELDRLGAIAAERTSVERDPMAQVAALTRLLADELGFGGDPDTYSDPDSSCLHRVLEKRSGLPITLAVVWIEVARRAGVHLLGIGMPIHFVIRPADRDDTFIDVFDRGRLLDRAACEDLVRTRSKGTVVLEDEHLQPVSVPSMVRRMLGNLRTVHFAAENTVGALRVTHFMTMLDPDLPELYRDRGALHLGLGDGEAAAADLERYLAARPDAGDAEVIRHLLAQARRTRTTLH